MKKTLITIVSIALLSRTYLFAQINVNNSFFVVSLNGVENNDNLVHFNNGGNDFLWLLFVRDTTIVIPETITLNTNQISWCTRQLRWLYFNPQRWNRLRPLDANTLSVLQIIDPSYNNLSINGWLYTNCSWVDPSSIYGYIQHDRLWTTFDLIAGTQINLLTNSYGNTFDETLTINQAQTELDGYLFDPLWWVAQIGVVWICGNGLIEVGETCDDNNTTNSDWCNAVCQIESWRQCTGQPSTCTPTNTPPWNSFNAWLQFPSSYTNTQNVTATIQANHPASYLITTWLQYNVAWTFNLNDTVNMILTAGDWTKTVGTRFTSLNDSTIINHNTNITLDTVDPTINITSPTNQSIITWNTIPLSRTGDDDNAGIAYYDITIENDNGIVYTTTTQNSSRTTPNLSNGTYTITIIAYDNAGNSTTEVITITIANNIIPTIADIPWITNANLEEIYTSQSVIVAWLPANYLFDVSVSTWVLLINWLEEWTTWSVYNGDTIQIQLQASNEYDTTTTATLNWDNITKTFSITTKESADDENETNEWWYCENTKMIVILARSIIRTFEDRSEAQKIMILELFLSLLEDEIQRLASQNDERMYALQCFYDIIDRYLINIRTNDDDGLDDPNRWFYGAPNGKQYEIEFIPGRDVYTSPNFVQPKFYATYEALTKHIDKYNPSQISRDHVIDTSFQPIFHTAPNGKIYKIQKTNKWYMSYTFIAPRYFTTLQEMKSFINDRNK